MPHLVTCLLWELYIYRYETTYIFFSKNTQSVEAFTTKSSACRQSVILMARLHQQSWYGPPGAVAVPLKLNDMPSGEGYEIPSPPEWGQDTTHHDTLCFVHFGVTDPKNLLHFAVLIPPKGAARAMPHGSFGQVASNMSPTARSSPSSGEICNCSPAEAVKV